MPNVTLEKVMVDLINKCKGDETGVIIIKDGEGTCKIVAAGASLPELCFFRVLLSTHIDHLVFSGKGAFYDAEDND